MMIVDRVMVYTMADEDPDLSYLDPTDEEMGAGFRAFAQERRAAWESGDWEMVGIVCDVYGRRGSVSGKGSLLVRSSVWGVESDSGAEALREMGLNEVNEAREELQAQHGLTFDNSMVEWDL